MNNRQPFRIYRLAPNFMMGYTWGKNDIQNSADLHIFFFYIYPLFLMEIVFVISLY